MFSFLLSFIQPYFNYIKITLVIVVIASLAIGYHYFVAHIKEQAISEYKNTQLVEILKEKDDQIEFLKQDSIKKDTIIADDQQKIENSKTKIEELIVTFNNGHVDQKASQLLRDTIKDLQKLRVNP